MYMCMVLSVIMHEFFCMYDFVCMYDIVCMYFVCMYPDLFICAYMYFYVVLICIMMYYVLICIMNQYVYMLYQYVL